MAEATATAGIRTIAVLGAGTMGRGIAHVSALAGFVTHLYDPEAAALAKAVTAIDRNLARGVELKKVAAEAAERARAALRMAAQLPAAVAAADLVIESAPEDIAVKVRLFQEVDRLAPEHALLASNTSALSITEMAAATRRPERFAGMHFFNPVHVMRLIELVRGLATSPATLATLHAVGRRMGKEIVLVNEAPGFVTSRINALIGNEAFRMLQEGVASAADIDKALKLGLNHPMGPFEMVDLVGLDVRLSILEFLHRTLGEAYRPNQLLVQHVRAGRLGRKVGRGVYAYDERGERIAGEPGRRPRARKRPGYAPEGLSGMKRKVSTGQAPPSTASAPTYSAAGWKQPKNQRAARAASPCRVSMRGGSPGSRVTSKESSGAASPSPTALRYASLRVQQLKKARCFCGAGSRRSATRSLSEKKRSAICSKSGIGLRSSRSTPISRPRRNPASASS